MSDFITKLSELIDPEVMGDMVSARIPKKLRVAPFAKIDDTLQGVPGDTITVPAYTYIGDASDVAEGGEVAIEKMTTSTRKATIKKAMKGIGLTDEAVLSGYGNPVGEANTQLAQAIAAKVDNDCMDALQTASLIYDGSQAQISYNAIVDAVDLFEEEMGCSDKVLFIHPKQVTQLRKNPDFLSADKYTPGVSLTGEIGMIAGCRLAGLYLLRRGLPGRGHPGEGVPPLHQTRRGRAAPYAGDVRRGTAPGAGPGAGREHGALRCGRRNVRVRAGGRSPGHCEGERRQRERDLHRAARAVLPHAGRPGGAFPPRGGLLSADRAVAAPGISCTAIP